MWRATILLTVACGSAEADKSPIVELNKRVADKKLDRNARCGAVFELFSTHLAPGATAAKARAVLTERAWIVVDNPVTVVGGMVPVEMTFDDSVFVVHCYAEPEPRVNDALWSDWVIYGRLSGKSASTLRGFLSTKKAGVRLVEYALVRPDGRIERHR